MSFSSLLLFAGVYLAAVATPGPGVAAIVARVLAQGLKGIAPFIAGFVVGDLIWLAVAATGLAMLAREFAALFTIIRYAGVAYLLWLAWRIWRAPAGAVSLSAVRSPRAGAAARPFWACSFVDARQSQGDRLLSVDHALGRRRPCDERDDLRGSRRDHAFRTGAGAGRLCAGRQSRSRSVSFAAGAENDQSRGSRGDGGRSRRGRDAVALTPSSRAKRSNPLIG